MVLPARRGNGSTYRAGLVGIAQHRLIRIAFSLRRALPKQGFPQIRFGPVILHSPGYNNNGLKKSRKIFPVHL